MTEVGTFMAAVTCSACDFFRVIGACSCAICVLPAELRGRKPSGPIDRGHAAQSAAPVKDSTKLQAQQALPRLSGAQKSLLQ